MLKLKSLIQLTPADIRARALQQCIVNILKSVIDVDNHGEHKKVLAKVKANDGYREVTIKLYDIDKAKSGQSPAWVHCACPYFTYYLEVALTARGSSSIYNSNGAYPGIRNPNMTPYLCKHLMAVAPTAMKIPAKRVKDTKVTNKDIQDILKDLRSVIPGKK